MFVLVKDWHEIDSGGFIIPYMRISYESSFSLFQFIVDMKTIFQVEILLLHFALAFKVATMSPVVANQGYISININIHTYIHYMNAAESHY